MLTAFYLYLVTACGKAYVVQGNVSFVISPNDSFKPNPERRSQVKLNLSTEPRTVAWITCKQNKNNVLLLLLILTTAYHWKM